jgi:hypothetical protein
MLSMETVQAFITYFQLRCSASTVLAKAFHLRTVSRYAERFYSTIGEDSAKASRAGLMTDFLTSACSVEKYEARRGTARMRSEDRRIERGALLAGDDFSRFGGAAEKIMCSIMNSGAQQIQRSQRQRSRGMYLYSIGKGFGLWHVKAGKDMCLCIMLGNIRLAGGWKWAYNIRGVENYGGRCL